MGWALPASGERDKENTDSTSFFVVAVASIIINACMTHHRPLLLLPTPTSYPSPTPFINQVLPPP